MPNFTDYEVKLLGVLDENRARIAELEREHAEYVEMVDRKMRALQIEMPNQEEIEREAVRRGAEAIELAEEIAHYGEALIRREYEPGSVTVTELVEKARAIVAKVRNE